MKKITNKKGFTIVELVIVIAVIAILAAVLIPTFSSVIDKANDSKAMQEAKNAYTEHLIDATEDGNIERYCVYKADEKRFVALDNGSVIGVYESEEAALEAMDLDADMGSLVATDKNADLFIYVAETPNVPVDPTDWSGASAVFVGDSITAASNPYHTWVATELGLNAQPHMGISGSCISATSNYSTTPTPLINRWEDIPDVELIVIFMGTNDFGHASTLGTIDDTTDVSFYGALNVILPGIQAAHPDSQIVMLTPLHRYHKTAPANGITSMTDPEDNKPNAKGATLEDYVNAIKEVSQKYEIPVVDMFNLCELDPQDTTYFNGDGLHPNAKGHEEIAKIISEELKKIPRKDYVENPEPPIDPTPDDTADYSLIIGNRFGSAADASSSKRICTEKNIYLTAGTILLLKDEVKYDWAVSKENNATDATTGKYCFSNGWDSAAYRIVAEDGYYGFTLKEKDDAVFDVSSDDSNELSDYFFIFEQIDMVNDNRFAPNASTASHRLSSSFNIYLPVGATVTFKSGTDATHWAVSLNSTAVSNDQNYQKDSQNNAWRSPDTFTAETAGYYGFTFKNDGTILDHNNYNLFDFLEISIYPQS